MAQTSKQQKVSGRFKKHKKNRHRTIPINMNILVICNMRSVFVKFVRCPIYGTCIFPYTSKNHWPIWKIVHIYFLKNIISLIAKLARYGVI